MASTLIRAFRGAMSFMTVLPLGGEVNEISLYFLPLSGAVVGLVAWLGFRLFALAGSPLLAAAVAIGVDAWVTRGLHYDALADTVDGLGGFLERQRRLQVMDEPTVGAFGVLAIVIAVALRISALGAVGFPLYLIGFFVVSRTAMVLILTTVPLAKERSIARIFGSLSRKGVIVAMVAYLAASITVIAWLGDLLAVPVAALGLAAAYLVTRRASRLIGGVTGDVVGAAGLVCETVMLLAWTLARLHG